MRDTLQSVSGRLEEKLYGRPSGSPDDPNNRRRAKTHGFRARMKSKDGQAVISRRRAKGRWKLTVSDERAVRRVGGGLHAREHVLREQDHLPVGVDHVARGGDQAAQLGQLLHGGWGYAEEYPISRYVADAQVLPIFEGVKPILALKVVGRSLLGR